MSAPLGFHRKLQQAWLTSGSLLCVGLDPDVGKLPTHVATADDSITAFCTAIVDATAPFCCAFKPQIAYFASIGAERQLETICRYIAERYPQHVLVLDAKRGDIGSTAEHYAREAFERYGADAVTINPYLGTDSVEPFLRYEGKGAIILCRTSNPGGDELQSLLVDGRPLYTHIAERVADQWSRLGECALVVGATYAQELAAVRQIVGDLPLLVPGIGAQGGDVRATVEAGQTANGCGLMISSSRAVLYASNGQDFADAAARVASDTNHEINSHRRS